MGNYSFSSVVGNFKMRLNAAKFFFIGLFVSLFSLYSFGQPVKVLDLKSQNFFSEKNLFYADSVLYIQCEIEYNDSRVIDEEYSHSILLAVKDLEKFKAIKFLDLAKDTSIVSCIYGRLSVWNWNTQKSNINGQIKILSITQNTIKLDLDVSVKIKEEEYLYQGTRKFKRGKTIPWSIKRLQ